MREDYRRLDSYGYEYVEGIVAGVPELSKYDVELDAGLPAEGAGPDDDVADVVIDAGDLTLDREGSLNNFLIEPTVFGTNDRFTAGQSDLPKLGQTRLPKANLIVALADYAVDGFGRLDADARAWEPSEKDVLVALSAMTPTLADYFEEWKESQLNGGAAGGRFVAVSRVSDMRGIMGSTRLMWGGVESEVRPHDEHLADAVSRGYDGILAFIDRVESREQAGQLTPEAIDALGSQAKEQADQLTAQVDQSAALLGIDLEAN